MNQRDVSPVIIMPGESARILERLPRMHSTFDEHFLQELLVTNPELLPVNAIRDDIGSLLCVGREVTVSSGSIDNLYLSTEGYPVVVETKLWRNPQARREVLSQTLDYVKEIVQKDFEWFSKQWDVFRQRQNMEPIDLLSQLNNLSDDEIDETFIVDRVNRALTRGDVIALIVGDGIETRLQELVEHLCRDSSHLRYSLALVELACYKLGDSDDTGIMVVPRVVQDIEPVQRAYVRVDVSEALRDQVQVTPVLNSKPSNKNHSRVSLNEEDFLLAIEEAAGRRCSDLIQQFCDDLVKEFALEPDFKAAALMLKVPHPDGDGLGASILAIEKLGRVYNTRHMRNQLKRWGLAQETVERILSEYWTALNSIDSRLKMDGIGHLSKNQFVPFVELVDKLPEIKNLISQTVADIRLAYDESR